MRISGGQHRGRVLSAPSGKHVRPATDKVRQAVFNSLLSRIDLDGGTVLDGFCGTGSYGLEALSRGAAFCTFIDKDSASIRTCQENISALGVGPQSQLLRKDILKLPEKPPQVSSASLLFLDPPYHKGLLLTAFRHLRTQGWLAPGALCVLECEKDLVLPGGESRFYGEVQIVFIRENDKTFA